MTVVCLEIQRLALIQMEKTFEQTGDVSQAAMFLPSV